MTLLATTRIANIPIEILEQADLKLADGTPCFGITSEDDHGIHCTLTKGLGPQKFMETLIHELAHAVEYVLRLNLTEREVTMLGVGLGDALGNMKWWGNAAERALVRPTRKRTK